MITKNKKTTQNFIWNTIGATLSSFNSLFFLMLITRINGIEGAGIFSISFAIASLLYIFAIYSGRNGQITATTKEISDKEYIVARVITSIIMLIITVGYLGIVRYDTNKAGVVLALCLWKALEAFADVFYAILQKNEKLQIVGKSLTIKALLGLFSFGIIDIITHNLVYACFMLVLTSLIIILCYDIPNTKKQIQKTEKIHMKNVFKIYQKEFYLFANMFLVMYLLNAPKYSIENHLTEETQAIFGMILMPASILPLFAQFIAAPVISKITKAYKVNKMQIIKKIEKQVNFYIICFGILVVVIGYGIGIPILNLIYHIDLTCYQIDLTILLISYILYALGYIKIILLTVYRKMKQQFWVHILVGFIALIVSDVIVLKLGIQGATISYFIIMLSYYILLALITKPMEKRIQQGKDKNHINEEEKI